MTTKLKRPKPAGDFFDDLAEIESAMVEAAGERVKRMIGTRPKVKSDLYMKLKIQGPTPPNERVLDKHFGAAMGENVTSNWYGPFSSGYCGMLSYWHIDEHAMVMRIDGAFIDRIRSHKTYVYRYPELECDRANGNIGSRNVAFNCTKPNLELVKRILGTIKFTMIIDPMALDDLRSRKVGHEIESKTLSLYRAAGFEDEVDEYKYWSKKNK